MESFQADGLPSTDQRAKGAAGPGGPLAPTPAATGGAAKGGFIPGGLVVPGQSASDGACQAPTPHCAVPSCTAAAPAGRPRQQVASLITTVALLVGVPT